MLDNVTEPFTIIKENIGDAFGNQYRWTHAQGTMKYLIENITILQEPTEIVTMDVMFVQEIKSGCTQYSTIQCDYCDRHISTPQVFCPNTVGNIYYDLRIDFHNYLHEFSSSYSYEVVCKIPRVNKPDEYLFTCVETRSDKTVIFKKCYISTAFKETFDVSTSNLYFGIRRLNIYNSEIRISNLLSVISTFQNIDDAGDGKVLLQARDGQIPVHKSVLSQYSEVFQAMFAHEMTEKQNGVVKIPDVEFNVIEKIVDYLYTEKLGNITGMTEGLFKVAHRYQIQELCRRCEEYYIFNVQPNNDNIVEILQLADHYELIELKNSANKFVHRHEQTLATLPSYQGYLLESLNIRNVVGTLILADKYKIGEVKDSAFEFIKQNYHKMVNCDDFLKLFDSNPRLMKEVYVFSFHESV